MRSIRGLLANIDGTLHVAVHPEAELMGKPAQGFKMAAASHGVRHSIEVLKPLHIGAGA